MTGTRDRIVRTTAELFRRQGFAGTGLKQIVAEARAPFGSVYHFFPGGKEQLGAEVIRSSGHEYQKLLETIFDAAPDIVTGVARCFSGAAKLLADTGYADACPIETVALEVASTNETLRIACAEVFEAWFAEATRRLIAAGLGKAKARELAILFVCTLEGAFVLSRTLRSAEPIEAAGRFAAAAVAEALPAHQPRRHEKRARGQ